MSETTINRLRVRASGLDPLTTRLRTEFALNTSELHPPGLPASVVLCVRRMRDPRPGMLDLSGSGRPAAAVWQQAVQETLAQLARSAARPAREAVPAGAEAVLFADMAELLACMARDWLEGSLLSNWWWQAWPRDLEPKRLVVQTWIDAPAYIPAALEELAVQRVVIPFARQLDPHDALRILSATLRHARLSGLVSSLSASSFEAAAIDHPRSSPPWQPYAPESLSVGLEPSQRALLGIGLSLRRAPRFIRRTEFASAIRLWLETKQGVKPREWRVQPAPSARPADEATTNTAPPRRKPEVQLSPADETEPQDSRSPDAIQHRDSPSLELPPPRDIPFIDSTSLEQLITTEPSMPEATLAPLPMDAVPPIGDSNIVLTEPPLPIQTRVDWPMPLSGQWFETGLGGLFYLINLGIYCGLYGDFTTPLEPGLDLSIWDFITLLGRALLGEDPPADPIWEWLPRLAGRGPEDPAGAEFSPPDAWRLPVDWLAAFPSAPRWRWSATGGRLCIYHPSGFYVVDVPLEQWDVEDQLDFELLAYVAHVETAAPDSSLMGSAPMDWVSNLALARWLGWLVPYARGRLCLALGLEHPDELPRVLCTHPARIYLTETHLDITFPLNNLSVAVRLASLDRNPGWVPAANRYVTFYYE